MAAITLTTETKQPLTSAALGGLEAFAPFARRSLSELLDFGQEMTRILESCTTPEAKKAFHNWAARQYGTKFAEKAIAFRRWWSELTQEIQQQIQQIDLSYWPITTALSLMKLGDRLEGCLGAIADLSSVTLSRVVNLIRRFVPKGAAPLRLGKTASDADWEYVQKKLGLSDGELAVLQQQAESLAVGERILTTDMIVEAIEASGYDANLVLWKDDRFERQLASREQELEREKQVRLAAQMEKSQTQTELKETQLQLQAAQAELLRLQQQIAEFQGQSTDDSEESAEIAVPAEIAVVSDDEEIPHLKQITPDPETGEPIVNTADEIAGNEYAASPLIDGQLFSSEQELEREKPDWLNAQLEVKEQEAKSQRQRQQTVEFEPVSPPLPAPARPQKKRKRKRDIFLSEMARLGVRN